MTEEQQRIAIAEACGWQPIYRGRKVGSLYGYKKGNHRAHSIPEYLSDLNAMHEAEKVKEMTFNSDYVWWLGRIACDSRGMNPDRQEEAECRSMAVFATAAQRAEAFLRTLGL